MDLVRTADFSNSDPLVGASVGRFLDQLFADAYEAETGNNLTEVCAARVTEWGARVEVPS